MPQVLGNLGKQPVFRRATLVVLLILTALAGYIVYSSFAASTINGLSATYFDNVDFSGTSVARIDPKIDFNWSTISPDPKIANTTWSARWTGTITAPKTGTYQFSTSSDDGVRVWINNELIVNSWATHTRLTDAGTIRLIQGQQYPIKIEYYQNTGNAQLTLSWRVPGAKIVVVPTNVLSTTVTSTPTPTPTPTPIITPTPTTTPPPSAGLNLPRIPWEGGPNYWAQFSKAAAVGWTDSSFFPISVFMGKPDPTYVASLKDAGINLYMGVERDLSVFPLTNVTDAGLFAMPNLDPESASANWTPADVGTNPRAVAWFITDECDQGYSGCTGTEYNELNFQISLATKVRAYNDGRFLHSNFGNGVARTFWSPDTMDDHIKLMDSASADKYVYTSPDADEVVTNSPDWPAGANPATSAGYGWMTDQLRMFQDQTHIRPIWAFVETSRPYVTEPGARTITPEQIEGAVWSTLIHEARGVAYFQHSNDPSCDGYSIVECPTVHAAVKAINAQVKALAPVLNTQSYYNAQTVVNGVTLYKYSFNNGTDAMLKTYNGSAYIFADLGLKQTTGSKTFALPAGVNGTTVTVVGENRTLPVTNRTFTDTFAAEYSHHTYQISL